MKEFKIVVIVFFLFTGMVLFARSKVKVQVAEAGVCCR
jgi:hypothetical protein